MRLVKDYLELNKIAKEMVKEISEINEKYLNNDGNYPYDEVDKLIDKYDAMLQKLLKKRYSSFSEFLNSINSNRSEKVSKLYAPSKYEVLNMASRENINDILYYLSQNYKIEEEETMKKVGDKIFPIVKGMDLGNIIDLYRQSKKIVSGDSLGYLQSLFVGYIISNMVHNPARGKVRSNVLWTYEEVCKNILKEEVLREGKSSRSKK